MILESYFENNIQKINKKNDDDFIENYKIQICLGCDAASLTTFLKINNNNDDDAPQEEVFENYSDNESVFSNFAIFISMLFFCNKCNHFCY